MSRSHLTRRNSKRSLPESDSDTENIEKVSQKRRMDDGKPEYNTVLEQLTKLAESNAMIVNKLNDQTNAISNLDGKFQDLRDGVGEIRNGLKDVENRMQVTENKVQDIEKRLDAKFNLHQMIRASRASNPPNMTKSDAFWRSRRSFLIAPIESGAGEDINDNVRMFLKDKLGFTNDELEQFKPEAITFEKRMRKRNGQMTQVSFAKITCAKKFERDKVFSKLPNLPRQGGEMVEIDVPDHLLSKFRKLKSASFKLRKENMRTTIRFDEQEEDIQLLAKKQGEEWKKYKIQPPPQIEEEIITLP